MMNPKKIKFSYADDRSDSHPDRRHLEQQARLNIQRRQTQLVSEHNDREAQRRNHSDETIKKYTTKQSVTVNPRTGFTHIIEDKPVLAKGEDSTDAVDPIGEFVVGNAASGPVFKLAGKAALYGAGRLGNNYARSKIISQTLNDGVDNAALKVSPIENVGWFPKQTIEVSHASNTDQPLKLYFPERWDAKQEGANPLGIWFQGKLGTARTDLTNPGKGTKAFNARQLFADRPFHYKADLTLNKPIGTVGEVSDRSALSRKAEDLGSDGIIYNDVYDNGYNHNQVILSFKEPNASSNSFKSELDWSPESWFKHKYTQSDVEALNSHLAEYKQIEQEAKKNGTWLKMKDGSTWQGDPRSWVQLQSKDGNKLVQQEHFTGVPKKYANKFPTYTDEVWSNTESPTYAEYYAKKDGNIFDVTYPKDVTTLNYNGNNRLSIKAVPQADIPEQVLKDYKDASIQESPKYISLYNLSKFANQEQPTVINVSKVKDASGKIFDYSIIGNGVPRKSLIGNNGNFDLTNPNIYRITLPIGITTGAVQKH